MIKTQPNEIWMEYMDGRDYNTALGLYDTVEQNENFFIGNQWEGVNAPDLPKPTLNFLKRVVSYFVAMLVTDDIGISIQPHRETDDDKRISEAVNKDIKRVIESERVKERNRDALRNAAVDGDACFYLWFDPTYESGQLVNGDIRVENIQSINCHFGNRYTEDVQSQPYIIIAMRRMICDVVEEAEENGMPIEGIIEDTDERQGEKGADNQLCTVLIKLWKANGTVHAVKTTERVVIKEAWDTGLKLYPVAWMNWEKRMSSYHGQACITGLIQNQIAVNKLIAMTIRSVELNAFPKIIYDQGKFTKGWNNRVGEAIGIVGDPKNSFADVFRGADVSQQVMEVVDRIVSMTRDFMGASDAALGNINANNTSAILAVQQQSAVPLEIQRLAFFDFVEQYIRIMVDIMRANYGKRDVCVDLPTSQLAQTNAGLFDPIVEDDTPVPTIVSVDYDRIDYSSLVIDVGTAAYWSELTQMQTMDNLVQQGIVSDAVLYLESIPDKYIPNKSRLIESVKARNQAMGQQQSLAGADPRQYTRQP